MHGAWRSLHWSFRMLTNYLQRQNFPNFIAKKIRIFKWCPFTRTSHKNYENSKPTCSPVRSASLIDSGLNGGQGQFPCRWGDDYRCSLYDWNTLTSMAVPGLLEELGRHLPCQSSTLWAACPAPLSSPARPEACGQFPAGPGAAFPKKSACSLPTGGEM